MPEFVQQATTYGFDKASPYLDTACNKVPLLQSVVQRLVPYAKPSVQLADKIVDTALGLALKPVKFVQGTVSSISGKAVDCKAAVLGKVSHARGIASDRLLEGKTSAIEALQRYRSLIVERSCAVLLILQEHKALAITKFGQMSSCTITKLQTLAARLHLIELRDMAFRKASAGKKYVSEVKGSALRKGSAGKRRAGAFVEMAQGKAYSSAVRVAGTTRVDYVLQAVAKYASVPKVPVKKTNVGSGSEVELEKKSE